MGGAGVTPALMFFRQVEVAPPVWFLLLPY